MPTYTIDISGSGTNADPYRVDLIGVVSWTDNGDGTADVTLTDQMLMQLRGFAASAADAFNGGSAWADLKAIKPDVITLALVKQDLVNTVKKKYSEMNTVPSGFVVSYDNGTAKGLWKAQTDTTTEPTKDSSDWTLIFEI